MRHLIIRIGRTLAIAAALALLAGGCLARIAPTAVTHPALAAGCQGGTSQSCTGLDPIAEGCTAVNPDPVPDVRTPHGYTIQLRFASNCQAAWARILNAPAGTPFSVQSITGQGHENFNVPPGFNNGWTNMVDDQGTNQAKACADGVCTQAF